MTQTPTTIIVNGITGETIERPLTSDEIAESEALALQLAQREAEAQAKADARQSALAKLADLGLTQDEINAL